MSRAGSSESRHLAMAAGWRCVPEGRGCSPLSLLVEEPPAPASRLQSAPSSGSPFPLPDRAETCLIRRENDRISARRRVGGSGVPAALREAPGSQQRGAPAQAPVPTARAQLVRGVCLGPGEVTVSGRNRGLTFGRRGALSPREAEPASSCTAPRIRVPRLCQSGSGADWGLDGSQQPRGRLLP